MSYNSGVMESVLQELVNAIRLEDDQTIFHLIFTHFRPTMLKAMKMKGMSEADADDAFQSCMQRLIEKRSIHNCR